jgi:hypothetical protein
MRYFVDGARYDPGFDDSYEHADEVFESKEDAEKFIQNLLNRKIDPFAKTDFVVIYGEYCDFLTTEKVVEKVEITLRVKA